MAAALGQPCKIHGGKNYMARWIVSLMPRHLSYVEPYCGGCSVLFARDPDDESLWLPPHKGVSEVVNDLNCELTNFWRVLQEEACFAKFVRAVTAMPFSGIEYADASKNAMPTMPFDGPDAGRAVNFFVRNRQSLAGRMTGFTGITKTRTRSRMNNETSAWISTVEGLPAVHARLMRVLILPSQPAVEVIRKFDMEETLFYIDAPYVHSSRATTSEYGQYEMTDAEHVQLIEVLAKIRGKAMVSMYHHPIYDVLHLKYGWRHVEYELPNHAAGGKLKRRMVECLWMNYPSSTG
jgi:DNA adenine methylase